MTARDAVFRVGCLSIGVMLDVIGLLRLDADQVVGPPTRPRIAVGKRSTQPRCKSREEMTEPSTAMALCTTECDEEAPSLARAQLAEAFFGRAATRVRAQPPSQRHVHRRGRQLLAPA